MFRSDEFTLAHMNSLDIASAELPQGDLRLLKTVTARRLLAEQAVARLAYTGRDETPRVIPVNFLWNGEELVIPAFAGTYKVRDLAVRPDIAVCIDTTDGPPRVVMLRGKITMSTTDGVLPEYAITQRKVMGEGAQAYLASIDQPGLRMVRIGLRPAWAGLLDFQERFPARIPGPVIAALGAGNPSAPSRH